MARQWSGPQIEFLSRHLGNSTKDIVDIYNGEFTNAVRTYDSIQKKVKSLRNAIQEVTEEEETEESFEEQVAIHEPSPVHVTAADKREARQDAETWLREIVDFGRREIGHVSNVVASRAVRSDNSSLIVVLSDLHFGKFTEHFNLNEAENRLRSIPNQLISTSLPTIDEVVVILLGDIVEGEDIYATQNGKLECPAFEQVQRATKACWETILSFRELFGCRVRIETAPGNHGRMSKTAHEKTNWDNVIYYILKLLAHMHGDEEIVVTPNFNRFHTFEVKGKRIGIHHQGVKHAGTPAMREKVAGWASRRSLDALVHGHWHEWHIGNWQDKIVVSNGSLCGPDDLGEQMSKEDNARQGWFIAEPGKPLWNFSFLEWLVELQ